MAMHGKDNVNRFGYAHMEHRHYRTIAGIIKEMSRTGDFKLSDIANTAKHFANELRGTNSNFNRSRFLAACGVEE